MLDLNWQRWVAACCGSYSLRGAAYTTTRTAVGSKKFTTPLSFFLFSKNQLKNGSDGGAFFLWLFSVFCRPIF
jgi:hypothetical protein